MKRLLLWGALAGALGASLGCGSSDSLTGATPNVHGTWDATMTVTGGTQASPGTEFTVTFDLNQTGTEVYGTFSTQGGADGIVTGSVSGMTVTGSATQAPACAGSYDFVGTVDASGTSMTGTFDGSDCSGTLQATFTATKQ